MNNSEKREMSAAAAHRADISKQPNLRPSTQPMTPSAAAAYLALDVKAITRWARLGYLPAHPLGEGKRKFWRFLEIELAAWLAKTNLQDLA